MASFLDRILGGGAGAIGGTLIGGLIGLFIPGIPGSSLLGAATGGAIGGITGSFIMPETFSGAVKGAAKWGLILAGIGLLIGGLTGGIGSAIMFGLLGGAIGTALGGIGGGLAGLFHHDSPSAQGGGASPGRGRAQEPSMLESLIEDISPAASRSNGRERG